MITKFKTHSHWSTQSNTFRPWVIAGPCSAETEAQLFDTLDQIRALGINTFRAGVWKPRTRPGSFEGVGAEALKWIQAYKKANPDTYFAVEVALPAHVELALEHGIDIVWLGARSTVNPFTVQDIANALQGVSIPVMVKNPVNPDVGLWLGAFERLEKAGVTQMAAIHRGFSAYQEKHYRNAPMWSLAIELKTALPKMPLIVDPSHIAGTRALVPYVTQLAMDLNYDGLMVETHRDPDHALSDPKQQITPAALGQMLEALEIRNKVGQDPDMVHSLAAFRDDIDAADRQILDALAHRMEVVQRIGHFKKDHNLAVFDVDRWKAIFESRPQWGKQRQLDPAFVERVYQVLHQASINTQSDIIHHGTGFKPA